MRLRLVSNSFTGHVMRWFVPIVLSCVAVLAHAEDNSPRVVESANREADADKFAGSEYRPAISEANSLEITVAAGWEKLQPALLFCGSKKSGPDVTYVSVSNQRELAEYLGSHAKKPPVVVIDMACPRAFRTAAFLSAREGNTSRATRFLDRAQALAPYWPEPYSERGFLLNSSGDRANALIAYRRGLELAEKYHSRADVKATALRGIGWTLVETGDLAGAKKAYEDSLVAEPANPLATKELAYIADLQKSGKVLPVTPPFSTQTPDEEKNDRDQLLQYTRRLESNPFDEDAATMRRWLIAWITASPDIRVTVCNIFGPVLGNNVPHESELLVQAMFGNAVYQIEHPDRTDGELDRQLAGVESLLKAYSAIVASKSDARIAYFDDLLKHQEEGTLRDFLSPIVATKCSPKAASE